MSQKLVSKMPEKKRGNLVIQQQTSPLCIRLRSKVLQNGVL